MKKFIAKFRYWLALLIIVLTISNVTITSVQFKSTNEITTSGVGGSKWGVETE